MFLIVATYCLFGIGGTFPTILGLWFYFSAFSLTVSYFIYGRSLRAFGYAKAGQLDAAERMLQSIRNPKKQSSKKRACFYLTQAIIDHSKNVLGSAHENYRNALLEGTLQDDASAIAHGGLAKIYHLQGDEKEALRECSRAIGWAPSEKQKAEYVVLELEIERMPDETRRPVFLFRSESNEPIEQ